MPGQRPAPIRADELATAETCAPTAGAARGRGRPKRDHVGELNRKLLEHALDQFLEKGFEATSVNAICSSLGMSKRTVYAWYGDKLSLFRAALQRAVDDWVVSLDDLPALESEDDLEETLRRVARLLVARMLSPEGLRLIRITNAESHRMPEIGAYLYSRGSEPIVRFLSDLFRRRVLVAPGDTLDMDDLATAFLNLMSGPARLNAWGFPFAEDDVERFVRQRVRVFLHGVPHDQPGSPKDRRRGFPPA